jgi:hypothetical protein
VSLNAGGTLSWPVDFLRAWNLEGKKAKLYFVMEGQRVVVMTKDELAAYLRDRG